MNHACYTSIIYWLFHLTSDKYLGLTALTKLKNKNSLHKYKHSATRRRLKELSSWIGRFPTSTTEDRFSNSNFTVLHFEDHLGFGSPSNSMTHFRLNIFTKMTISLFSSPPYSLSFIWILVLFGFSHHLSKF